jgi:hypothetical protein
LEGAAEEKKLCTLAGGSCMETMEEQLTGENDIRNRVVNGELNGAVVVCH